MQPAEPVRPGDLQDVAVGQVHHRLPGLDGTRLRDRVAVVPDETGIHTVLDENLTHCFARRAHMWGRRSWSAVERSRAYIRSPSTLP